MSSYLAIAAVTGALQQMLQPAVAAAVLNAQVGFDRPNKDDKGDKSPLVNVYLYQVTPNTAHRNAELPTRRADGTLMQRPQAALDLHYLFTFHGDESKLEPQLLLGAVVSALEAKPVPSADDISAGEGFLKLGTTGLASQPERVRFTPTALTLEEFSKLWSVFFQVEYALSAAYQASVVLIESDVTPQEGLPVQTRNLYAALFRAPFVDRVISQSGADQPVVEGGAIAIQGRQLRGAMTFVLLEGQEFTPASVTDSEITLPVPASVHAGVKVIQVVQKTLMGSPPALHRGVESNGATLTLRPTIVNPAGVATSLGVSNFTLTLSPNIGAGQRAVLVLNSTGAGPAVSFVSEAVIAAAESNQVTLSIAGVPSGSYLVRVQVDGAESLLTSGPGGQFTGPKVNIP